MVWFVRDLPAGEHPAVNDRNLRADRKAHCRYEAEGEDCEVTPGVSRKCSMLRRRGKHWPPPIIACRPAPVVQRRLSG